MPLDPDLLGLGELARPVRAERPTRRARWRARPGGRARSRPGRPATEVEHPLALHVAEQPQLPLARQLRPVADACRCRGVGPGIAAESVPGLGVRHGGDSAAVLRTCRGGLIRGPRRPRACSVRAAELRRSLAPLLHFRPVSREIDYALARRLTVREYRSGALTRLDVCDAHPELLRAARNLGENSDDECPVCSAPGLRRVPVRLRRHAQGGQRPLRRGRRRSSRALKGSVDEFACYVVEVCVDCGWNYLIRSTILGRAPGRVRTRPDRGGCARTPRPLRSSLAPGAEWPWTVEVES